METSRNGEQVHKLLKDCRVVVAAFQNELSKNHVSIHTLCRCLPVGCNETGQTRCEFLISYETTQIYMCLTICMCVFVYASPYK